MQESARPGRKAAIAVAAVLLAFAAAVLIVSSVGSDNRNSKLAMSTSALSSDIPGARFHSEPTMSLVEYMKSSSFDDVPMLAESDITRAKACAREHKCSFLATTKVQQRTEMEDFDPVRESKHSKSDSDSAMEVFFDVFESNAVGCLHGHIAYQLNITKISGSGITIHETSDTGKDQTKREENDPETDTSVLHALRLHPFVFIQDTATGRYVDYVVPSQETPKVATIKRGLAESLNPIIGVSNEDRATKMEDGAILFQLRQGGRHGVRTTAYRLWHDPNEPGSHQVEHMAKLFVPVQDGQQLADTNEHNQEEVGAAESVDDEPESCAYPTPPRESDVSGIHHGRAQVVDDAVADASEAGDMHVGQSANQPSDPPPNQHAEEDEKEMGQYPVRAQVTVNADAQVQRLAETPFLSPCTVHEGLADKQSVAMTLAHWQQTVPSPEEAEHRDDVRVMVRHSFTSPALREDLNEQYTVKGGVDKDVRDIVKQTSGEHILNDPFVMSALRQACDHGAVRRGVLAYLRDVTVAAEDRDKMALHFIGACDASIDKKGTQGDLTDLATNEEVDELPREQALWALAQVRCPRASTLDKIYKLSQSKSYTGKSSLLILGALIKHARACTAKSQTERHATLEYMQAHIDGEFHQALKDGRHDDVETSLYAMSNSGGDKHMVAIKTAMLSHSVVLRSVTVQEAALRAVSKIALTSTGSPDGNAEHQQLLAALSVPVTAEDRFPHNAEELKQRYAGKKSGSGLHIANATDELANQGLKNCKYVGAGNTLCQGKRIPQNSVVSATVNTNMMQGRGIDSSGTCINYAQSTIKLSASVRADFGDFDYLNPLSLDIIECKAQMFQRRGKSPVSGYVALFGHVVMNLNSRNSRSNGMFRYPYSGGRPNLQGSGEGYYHPAGVAIGICGVQSQNFEGLSGSKEYHKDIVQPQCRRKYGHECRIEVLGIAEIRIDGFLIASNHYRFGVAEHQTGAHYAPRNCKRGVYVGHSASDTALRFHVSGSMELVIARGEMWASLNIVSIQYSQTSETVSGIYAKSAVLQFSALSGRVVGRLYHLWFRCSIGWDFWNADCEWIWSLALDKTLFSWSSPFNSGRNFLCDRYNKQGCSAFIRNTPVSNTWCGTRQSWKRNYNRYSMSANAAQLLDMAPTNQLYAASPPAGQALQDAESWPGSSTGGHCYMSSGAYRGDAAVAGNGQSCLPWPKGSTVRYRGSGLLKDPEACADIPMGSTCWESCVYSQETNNYCRDPTDHGVPFCRTGGTDAAPSFSDCTQLHKCSEADLEECSYSKPDGSDYNGDVAFTVTGSECDMWTKYPEWQERAAAEQWDNFCRNPDGKHQPWCLVKGTGVAELCDVGLQCPASILSEPSPADASGPSSESEPAPSAPPGFHY